MMSRRLFLIILMAGKCIWATKLCAQHSDIRCNDSTVRAKLLGYITIKKSARKVILFENDSFQIGTSFQILDKILKPISKRKLDTLIDNYLTEEVRLYKTLQNSKLSEINVDSMSNRLKFRMVLTGVTADLLQRGNCFVYNKKIKEFAKSVVTKWHTDLQGRDITDGAVEERLFYVDGCLLFTKVDGFIN